MKRRLPAITFILALFNAMFYFSMRTVWNGIYARVPLSWLALLLFFILLAALFTSFVLLRLKKPSKALLITSLVFFAALGYMLYEAWGTLPFFIYEFGRLAAIVLVLFLVSALIMKFPAKSRLLTRVKTPLVVVIAIATIGLAYGFPLGNGIKEGPVVFAVGDTYQIVYTSKSHSLAWVDVGDERFYDDYAGSTRVGSTVHKVEVPMYALDRAGAYTINAQTVFFRGPYEGVLGRVYSRPLAFSPLGDGEDLQIYAISDTHDYTNKASATASYWGDELDLLILLGDLASFINSETDLTRGLVIAHAATGGRVPVVYARGNHEVKGLKANELHRASGADGELFYYTFRVGNVWGVVLDAGENHPDDWWEFYGTARFDAYRERQIGFLQGINENAADEYNAPGVSLRLAICHIPFSYYWDNNFMEDLKEDWVAELNHMKIDLALSGHTHRLFRITPDIEPDTALYLVGAERPYGYAGRFNAPAVIVSAPTDIGSPGSSRNMGTGHTGLAIEARGGQLTLTYTNSLGEVVPYVEAFEQR